MNGQQKRKLDDFLDQNKSGIQNTVDEMIKAALDEQMSELACKGAGSLEREEQKIAALEKKLHEALKRADQAEKEASKAKVTIERKVDFMKKRFDNKLATKKAKIASLESQLANIKSMVREIAENLIKLETTGRQRT